MGRTDQGGHSAHPEMLNALLPAQIHRLAGDGLRHGQAIVSQGRLCFRPKVGVNGHIAPFDMPGNAPICGHAGLAIYDFPGLHQVIRQVTVRQIPDGQAVLALRENSGVNVRTVRLAGQVEKIFGKFHRLRVCQRQRGVIVQIISVILISDQEIPAQGRFDQLIGNSGHRRGVLLRAAGNVIVRVGHGDHAGLDLLLCGHLRIVL